MRRPELLATWRDRLRRALGDVDALAGARRVRHLGRTRLGRTDRRLIDTYLATAAEPKLHIGCGTRLLEGWLNTDWTPRTVESARLDIRRPFPFPDGAFRYVYAEHVVEHVELGDARRMCAEIHRVLQPGGVVRLATPDLDRLLALFRPDLDDIERRYIEHIRQMCWPDEPMAGENPVFTLNSNVRNWGHRFLFDADTLCELLVGVGFERPRSCPLQHSEHEALRALANERRMPTGLVDFETMTFEARRP